MTATFTQLDPPPTNRAAGAECVTAFASDAPAAWRASKLSRWLAILRYHRPRQLALRVAVRLEQKRLQLAKGGKYARRSFEGVRLRENRVWEDWLSEKLAERTDAAQRFADLRAGRFEFLGHSCLLPSPIDWRLTGRRELSHLWRFNLHYQEYLFDLANVARGGAPTGAPSGAPSGMESSSPAAAELAWSLVEEWIDGNPLSDPRVHSDAWHPFCISRRLPAWIALWLAASPPDRLKAKTLESFSRQAWFLSEHLERDLGGNHLLENARALAMAGSFLDGPQADGWLDAADRTLRSELPNQILPHGEHFERSPMYHTLMLGALLDVRDATSAVRPALSAYCGDAAKAMARFLSAILHPDGDIPLLGDAALGETAPIETLLRRAGEKFEASDAVKIGDYWRYRRPEEFLLFDAGPVAPDDLPAHGHADLLGLELSLGGRRAIVDSGVYSYAEEPLRHYCRSTKAHNVLQIDGVDQCDMWSRFRMGYRGWPSGFAAGETGAFAWARATHNAYRRIGVACVGRTIVCRDGGPWIIADSIGAETKGVRRRRMLKNRLHFHPLVRVELRGDDSAAVIVGGESFVVSPLAAGKLSTEEFPYCDRFGEATPAACLVWTASAELPAACGWLLQALGADNETEINQAVIVAGADGFRLRWSQSGSVLEWLLPTTHSKN